MTPTGWHCLTETATEEWARLSERGASQPYFYLVAHGIFGLVLDRFGGGRGPDARLFFTLNADLQMDAPIVAGREMRVYIRPIRRTEKVIDTWISILDMQSGNCLASCHHTGAYINRSTRRIGPLGENAIKLWEEQVAAEGLAAPMKPLESNLRGSQLQSFDGVIEAAWIDRMGHLGIEHYGLILDRAGENTLRTCSPPLTPALPKRIQVRYLKEIQLGRPFFVTSWVAQNEDAQVRMEHELSAGTYESPGELSARCVETVTGITIERTER